ncbi:MAG: phytanoyl-CoA dioxygenase family protein [Pseudomonadota bacterium]
MPTLRLEEIQHYRTEGYVIPGYRLPGTRLAMLQDALDTLLRDNPDTRPEHLISVHVDGPNCEGVTGSKIFLDLACDPDILDLVEAAIGPDIVLWGCHMFCKPAGDGMEVPWHQDGHYWPIRPLATCTVWIALESSDPGNGCLRVIPGSHRGERLFQHRDQAGAALSQRLAPDAFDEDKAVDLTLDPGQMSLHDVYLIHGSRPNRSDRRRAGLAIRYMPASSLFDRTWSSPDQSGLTVDFRSRPLWLLRGENRAGTDGLIA